MQYPMFMKPQPFFGYYDSKMFNFRHSPRLRLRLNENLRPFSGAYFFFFFKTSNKLTTN